MQKKWKEKHLYGYLKRETKEIVHEMTWKWLRRGNLRRETKSILIAAQKAAIRTNYIKVNIDNMQQNNTYRLCGVRDETITHIISECNKLAKNGNKTANDRVGKVIH